MSEDHPAHAAFGLLADETRSAWTTGPAARSSCSTRPLPVRVALVLPYAVVVLTGGTVVGAAWAWWTRSLSLAARLHQTLLALLGVAFVWQLAVLGFLSL